MGKKKDVELLTRKQVAEMFKIKPRTIWHWEQRGVIKPALYINGRPRYAINVVMKLGTKTQTVYWKKPGVTPASLTIIRRRGRQWSH